MIYNLNERKSNSFYPKSGQGAFKFQTWYIKF